jgi:LacI family transcriptional regulator
VFLCNSDNNNDKERDYIKVLKEKYVDGIIFTGSSISNCSYILDLVDSSIPVVIMDRDLESENINGVFLDNYEGGYAATKHLIDLGHTGIGCAIGPLTTKSARDRLEGYMNALRDNGIQVDNHLIREGEYNIKGGEEGAKKILENKGVTAIFASNDLMAYGVYKTVHSKGLKIPEDISVVGFDDIQFSQILEPQLTTINQPTYDMGVTATQILLKLIQGKTVRKKMVNFKPKLIVRKSTKKL